MVPSGASTAVTPPGIDPETIRLVVQCLNHYATPGPSYVRIEIFYQLTGSSCNYNLLYVKYWPVDDLNTYGSKLVTIYCNDVIVINSCSGGSYILISQVIKRNELSKLNSV